MKAQNRRVFQTVMRSPSPDIAHRSIITNTKSPANQIKEFMRRRQSSTSPKSMNTSFHQISKSLSESQEVNRLRRQIQELQARIKFLERIKISHQQLTIINQRLNGEIQGLKLQLRDNQQRNHSTSSRNISPNNVGNKSPRSKGVSLVKNQLTNNNNNQPSNQQNSPTAIVTVQTDNILREFNERIIKMSEENRRLGTKLKEIYDQKQNLERENNLLKTQKTQNRPSEVSTFNDTESLKRYFAEETDRITRYYQGLNENRMSQIGVRINCLQNEMGRLVQKVNKRPVASSPKKLKGTVSMDTNYRTQPYEEQLSSLQANRYGMAESKYKSPSEFKTVNLQSSPIQALEDERQKMKRENQSLYRKTMDVEGELKRVLLENNKLQKRLRQAEASTTHVTTTYKSSPLQQSNMSTYKANQQKIQELQHEVITKTTELRFKTMQIQELERRLREISGFREAETQNHMRVIGQEREKTLHYLKQLEKCQLKLSELQKNTVNKQQYLMLETELDRIKSLYDQFQNQYSQLKANFKKYLEMIMQIRHSLTGEDMEECLKDIEAKWTGYDELEMQIIKVHECHQLLIQQYKQNVLQKQQKIAQLEKQNLLLKQENQQNLVLVQKLQKAIYDYNQPSRNQMTEEQMKKRFNHHQSADKKNQRPCLIKDYINRTDRKLGMLEDQINVALQSKHEHKNQNALTHTINQSKYNFNPVEVESVYRKSTNTLLPQQRLQFSDAEQYEEQHEEIPDEYELMGKD